MPQPIPLSSLEKYYEWQQERFLALSKGAFSLSGLIFSPLLAAILGHDDHVDMLSGAAFVAGAAAALLAGLTFNSVAGEVAEEYNTIALIYP